MSPKAKRLSLMLAVVLLLTTAVPVMAAETVFFTLTAPSTYLFNAPSTSAAKVYSIFKGQTFGVLARSPDGVWLQLNFAGASQEAWVRINFGTVDAHCYDCLRYQSGYRAHSGTDQRTVDQHRLGHGIAGEQHQVHDYDRQHLCAHWPRSRLRPNSLGLQKCILLCARPFTGYGLASGAVARWAD
jgi:hypothetical protein